MKNLVIKTLSLFLGLSPAAAFCQEGFSAKMVFGSIGKERVFRVYCSGAGYRYEFNENGQEGVIIVKKGSPEIIILIPLQMMAMKGPAESPMNMGNDPVNVYEHYRRKAILKNEGEELVNGISCVKSTLWSRDNPTHKLFTVWLSEKYNFPIKLDNHINGSGDLAMELKEIQPWIPDAKSFSIPEGFQVMEMPKLVPAV